MATQTQYYTPTYPNGDVASVNVMGSNGTPKSVVLNGAPVNTQPGSTQNTGVTPPTTPQTKIDTSAKTVEEATARALGQLRKTSVAEKGVGDTGHVPTVKEQLRAREQQAVTPTAPVDNRTEYQKFRDSMYDEEKLRKESNRRQMVFAIGDALRNIGNLYYTTKGATPQNFGGYSPALEEQQRYEKGKAQRDATAYQLYSQKLAQDKAKADAERQAALDGSKIAYQNAQTQKILQDIGINAQKYPYEIQGMIADAAYKVAHAGNEEAKAAMSKLELAIKDKYGEQEAAATVAKIKAQTSSAYASAEASRASAANSYASAEKTRGEIKDGKEPTTAPIWNNGKYDYEYEWDLGSNKNENTRRNIASALANYAQTKTWVKDSDQGAASLEQVYSAVMQHAEDPVVQKVLSKYGKKVRRKSAGSSSSDAGRPGTARPSGGGGAQGGGRGSNI